MIRAFHTNWTAPFFARNRQASFAVEPFELLTTVLSARLWQACNGTIAMLCDSPAATYYDSIGLTALWDGGVHTVLDDIPQAVDPSVFWAAGKLFALRAFGAPCVMLDTDFIVWKPIEPLLGKASLAAIHREAIVPEIYPDAAAFPAVQGFDFTALDWTVEPANTALSYFGDPDFVHYYTDTALAFMMACTGADNTLTYMVFAEQRLLAMLAKQQGVDLLSFSDLPTLFTSKQAYFTHVWGFKQQMREQPAMYAHFCRRCAARITKDYPADAEILSQVAALSSFFQ